MMSEETKLKPCPACGTTDRLGLWHCTYTRQIPDPDVIRRAGICCDCGYSTSIGSVSVELPMTHVEAIANDQWNQRTPSPIHQAAAHLHHLHLCEMEGIEAGQPTPDQWIDAVEALGLALSKKYSQENMIEQLKDGLGLGGE